MEAQERHTNQVMAIPNVVGTAVGLGAAGQPVVKIYTESAGVAGLPRTLDGVPVVVQVTGKLFALHHRPGHSGGPGGGGSGIEGGGECTATGRSRPACIGTSTGHPNITAGTIGCRVTDGSNVYALSNNHVYAYENNASIGDPVLQPGSYDGGALPADEIGTLFDFEPIDFSFFAFNIIDAAIALSSISNLGNATPSGGYGLPKKDTISASVNLKVKKYGRTTGLTKGRITGINATLNVGYSSGVARFVNQIIIEPGGFSAGGDSGSLIVGDGKNKRDSNDRKPVGVLFAGSAFVTIANPIDAVLDRFGVSIDGE
jgi:hypothetical protein